MGGHNFDNKQAHSIYDINRVHVLKCVEWKPPYINLVKIDSHGQTHVEVSFSSLTRKRA